MLRSILVLAVITGVVGFVSTKSPIQSSLKLNSNGNGLPSDSNGKVTCPQSANRDYLKRSLFRLSLITATAAAALPRKGMASLSTVDVQEDGVLKGLSVEEQLNILDKETFSGVAREVIKSTSDGRAYKAITLDNGLRVLMISDPGASRGAAAIDVHVGSM